MSETEIKTDENWKAEAAVEKENMAAAEADPNRVWVPLDELETYLRSLSGAMLNMVNNMEDTVKALKENATNKGDNEDDEA